HGSKPGFLRDLDEQGVPYVGEVPRSFACFTSEPPAGESGHWAYDLVRHSPAFYRQPWQTFALARQTVGEQPWQAKGAPIWVKCDGVALTGPHWLICARNERSAEEKFFILGVTQG